MSSTPAIPIASAGPLAGMICVLGVVAGVGWRFGARVGERLVFVVGGVGVRQPGRLRPPRTSGAPATIASMPLRVLGSAAREFRNVLRATTPTHRRLRDHLVTIVVVTVGIDLFCAIAAFLLERHSQQTEIKTFGSAVFWTTTQLLTVSSQIKNPISAGGRILDVFMEIWAITVVAALAGAFGSFLQKRGQEMDAKR